MYSSEDYQRDQREVDEVLGDLRLVLRERHQQGMQPHNILRALHLVAAEFCRCEPGAPGSANGAQAQEAAQRATSALGALPRISWGALAGIENALASYCRIWRPGHPARQEEAGDGSTPAQP